MRRPRLFAVLAASTAVAVVSVLVATLPSGASSASSAQRTAPSGTPTAVRFNGVPYVGPLFGHDVTHAHICTASVVLSPRRNLILTAAHCVRGSGAGMKFAPGYVNGRAPYGVWTVQKAWATPRRVASQSPLDDYVFLQVAPRNGTQIQSRTGGALIGLEPDPGDRVTVVGYQHGLRDRPVRCSNAVVYTNGYPTFDCHGFPGGTSGSPFLARSRGRLVVLGVIGGAHNGGCYEWNSFSSPFGWRSYATYVRAVNNLAATTLPTTGVGDNC